VLVVLSTVATAGTHYGLRPLSLTVTSPTAVFFFDHMCLGGEFLVPIEPMMSLFWSAVLDVQLVLGHGTNQCCFFG
jgi:hypothetical protein